VTAPSAESPAFSRSWIDRSHPDETDAIALAAMPQKTAARTTATRITGQPVTVNLIPAS
jgi:hypothetical protein